jgi:uncharacterized protein with NRDE domain
MCTLVAAVRCFAEVPLLVAANRDERLDRPARGPFLWPGPPRLVSPRDEVAGGSWLGINEHGVFVGITNRAGAPPDPARRSRGALVIDALAAASASALHERLADLDPRSLNPFHLLYADAASAHLTWSDGATRHQRTLESGLHVISERSPAEGTDTPRAARIRARWTALADSGPPEALALRALLSEHEANHPFDAVCVHADALGYGTRSSAVLRLAASGHSESELWWAEGKPCVTELVDRRDLLRDLAGAAR